MICDALATEVPVFALEDEIDATAIVALQRRIKGALNVGLSFIVVDLSAVTVLSGQTLSVFCGALRHANRCGARLTIIGARPRVVRALELCAIDDVALHQTLVAAVASERRPDPLPVIDATPWAVPPLPRINHHPN